MHSAVAAKENATSSKKPVSVSMATAVHAPRLVEKVVVPNQTFKAILNFQFYSKVTVQKDEGRPLVRDLSNVRRSVRHDEREREKHII